MMTPKNKMERGQNIKVFVRVRFVVLNFLTYIKQF